MSEFKLLKIMGQAINDYDMLNEGDRVVVGVSGGVDSIALLLLLNKRLSYIPSKYEIFPVFVDKFNGENSAYNEKVENLSKFIKENTGLDLNVIHLPIILFLSTSSIPKRNYCYACANKRRAEILKFAKSINANKVAFAHHKDDIIQTSLMNVFYKRELSTMLPRLPIFNGAIEIIRPLSYLTKKEIEKYILCYKVEVPVIEEYCPLKIFNRNSRREEIKNLIEELEKKFPNIKNNIFAAFRNPKPDYLLNYLFNPKTTARFKRP